MFISFILALISSLFIYCSVYKNVNFLFPVIDLIENTHRYLKFTPYSCQHIQLTMDMKAMCKYCSKGSGYDLNPPSKYFFNYMCKL